MTNDIIGKFDILFDYMQTKNFPSFGEMQKIADIALDDNFAFPMDYYERAVECLAIAKLETDIRVFQYYVAVFKTIFMRAENWQEAMETVYQHDAFKNNDDKLPLLRENYDAKKFDNESSSVIRKMLSLNSAEKPQFGQLCKEFSFYLTLAPKPVIKSLMTISIMANHQNATDIVIEVLRKIPAFFTLRVPHTYHPEKKELLMIAMFRHLIRVQFSGQNRMLDIIKHIVTELTCTRNPNKDNEMSPVIEAAELIDHLIIDLLAHLRGEENINLLLDILLTMLCDECKEKSWKIWWKKSAVSNEPGIVPTVLQNAVYHLLQEKPNKQLRQVYASIYKRLKADNFELTPIEVKIGENFLKEEEERAEQETLRVKAEQEEAYRIEQEALQLKAMQVEAYRIEQEALCIKAKQEEEARRQQQQLLHFQAQTVSSLKMGQESVETSADLQSSSTGLKRKKIFEVEEDEIEEDSTEANENEHDEPMKKSKRDIAIDEGRVVFLRNLPFNTTYYQLKGWVDGQQIGKVEFLLRCCSKDRGQKDSAFVHFQQKEAADKFLDKLNNHDGMLFEGQKLSGYRAVPKGEENDQRNLYLLRASLIRPGTKQANEMSSDDANYRERLAQAARAKLAKLSTFVSPIHNIPFSFDDSEIRRICQRAAEVGADSITECRIMRHVLSGEDGRPIFGKSKGFGFVKFKTHTAALKCLEQLNNNPEVFTNERRPIIEFSIEDINTLREGQPGTSKDSEFERKLKAGDDPLAVEKTKRELMAGGRKWVSKKIGGKKMRHVDEATGNRKSRFHLK